MSLVETLLSMALAVALSGSVLSLVSAGQSIARTQPETADLQQRARLALNTLGRDMRSAGAGLDRGLAGPLNRYFPAITLTADGGVTMWTVIGVDAQASVATTVDQGATTVALDDAVGCPAGDGSCGFTAGASAMAFTAGGCRTTLQVADAVSGTLALAAPLTGCTLGPGSAVAEAVVRTYSVDAVSRQLLRHDEVTGSTSPVLDGVAAMSVALYADADGTETVSGITDRDLMRVRRVRITLRFVASNPLLKIPDLTVAIDAVPRNLEGW